MHHINISNKRRKVIKLFTSYAVIAVALIGFTYVLVLIASGYDIDRSTGQVIRNGVLLLDTEPEDAEVYLNGQRERDITPSRFALPAGKYELKIVKENYRDWVSNIRVTPSQVTWLYHPKLIPNIIDTENILTYEGLRFIEADDSSERLVAYQKSRPNVISIYTVNDDEIEADNITIPNRLFNTNTEDSPLGDVSLVEWSSDANFLLLKYETKATSEHWVIDIQNPDRSSSIDQELGIHIDSAFFGSKNNAVYIHIGDMVREYDKRSRLAPKVWARDVSGFAVEDGDVWFKKTGIGAESGIYRLGKDDEALISWNNSTDKIMQATNYESDSVVALMVNGKIEVYRGVDDNPNTNIVEKVIRYRDENTKIKFSDHGRFLAVLQSNDVLVYDLETQREYKYTLNADGAINWLDANRLHFSQDGMMHIVDFTGENDYQIASYVNRWGAHVNEEQSAIFSVGRQESTGRLILHRSITSLE